MRKVKKPNYKCPNCGNTNYIPVYNGVSVVEGQKKCSECGHVLTEV